MSLPIQTWGQDSSSNRFKQTYMKGYLDISGGDLSLQNGNLYLYNGTQTPIFRITSDKMSVMSSNGVFTDISLSLFTQLNSIGDNVTIQFDAVNAKIQHIDADVSSTTITSDIFVTGNTHIGSNVYLNNYTIAMLDVSLNSNLFVGENLSVHGNSNFIQNVDICGNLDTQHIAIHGNLIAIEGNTLLNNTTVNTYFNLLGDASLNGNLNLFGDASLNRNLNVLGDTSLKSNVFVSGKLVAFYDTSLNGNLSVGEISTFGGPVYALQDASFGGPVYANSELFVNGNVQVNGDVSLNNHLFVLNDASFNSNVNVLENNNVFGDISLNGNLLAHYDVSINGNLRVKQNSYFTGDISINGNVFASNLFISAPDIVQGGTNASPILISAQSNIIELTGNSVDTSYFQLANGSYIGQTVKITGITVPVEGLFLSALSSNILFNNTVCPQMRFANTYQWVELIWDGSKWSVVSFQGVNFSSINMNFSTYTSGSINLNPADKVYVKSDLYLYGGTTNSRIVMGKSNTITDLDSCSIIESSYNTIDAGSSLMFYTHGSTSDNSVPVEQMRLNASGTLLLNGDASLNANLNVAGKTFLYGDVSINGITRFYNDVSLNSNLRIQGNIYVKSPIFGANLSLQTDTSNETLYIGTASGRNGILNIASGTNITSPINIGVNSSPLPSALSTITIGSSGYTIQMGGPAGWYFGGSTMNTCFVAGSGRITGQNGFTVISPILTLNSTASGDIIIGNSIATGNIIIGNAITTGNIIIGNATNINNIGNIKITGNTITSKLNSLFINGKEGGTVYIRNDEGNATGQTQFTVTGTYFTNPIFGTNLSLQTNNLDESLYIGTTANRTGSIYIASGNTITSPINIGVSANPLNTTTNKILIGDDTKTVQIDGTLNLSTSGSTPINIGTQGVNIIGNNIQIGGLTKPVYFNANNGWAVGYSGSTTDKDALTCLSSNFGTINGLNGLTLQSFQSKTVNILNSGATSGSININSGVDSSGATNIANGQNYTGTVNICANLSSTGVSLVTIGQYNNANSTVSLRGGVISAFGTGDCAFSGGLANLTRIGSDARSGNVTVAENITTGNVNIGTTTYRTGNINIGTGVYSIGNINIGNATNINNIGNIKIIGNTIQTTTSDPLVLGGDEILINNNNTRTVSFTDAGIWPFRPIIATGGNNLDLWTELSTKNINIGNPNATDVSGTINIGLGRRTMTGNINIGTSNDNSGNINIGNSTNTNNIGNIKIIGNTIQTTSTPLVLGCDVSVNGNIISNKNISALSFNATSDYRIKTDVFELDNSYSSVYLRPVSYFNNLLKNKDLGFLAHEVQTHYPFLVNGEKDGKSNQSLNYLGIIPILVNDIKRMDASILSKDKQIKALSDRIEKLEKQSSENSHCDFL